MDDDGRWMDDADEGLKKEGIKSRLTLLLVLFFFCRSSPPQRVL